MLLLCFLKFLKGLEGNTSKYSKMFLTSRIIIGIFFFSIFSKYYKLSSFLKFKKILFLKNIVIYYKYVLFLFNDHKTYSFKKNNLYSLEKMLRKQNKHFSTYLIMPIVHGKNIIQYL